MTDFSSLDAVIFDLGGVLLPLDFPALIRAFDATFGVTLRPEEGLGIADELHERFERGEVSAGEFRAGLRARFSSRLRNAQPSDHEVDVAWNSILRDVPPRHVEAVRRLRETKKVLLLSNTNEIHAAAFEARYEAAFERESFRHLFDAVYYSHELGMRKPEERIFLEVLKREDLDPARTLFIDDNAGNIRAAEKLGVQTLLHRHNEPLALSTFPS